MEKDKNQEKEKLTLKQEAFDFGKILLIALVVAGIFRSLFLEPFSIPSGSMYPTLEVGDHLFVSKPTYGYGRFSFPFGLVPFEGRIAPRLPKRGDIVVFKRSPDLFGYPYIKRIIGLPGDRIQMRGGRLYINRQQIKREFVAKKKYHADDGTISVVDEYTEILPGNVRHQIYEESDDGALDNTPVYEVPEGNYFLMGDNRDHSQDSRVSSAVGYVKYGNIIGRADIIFFSVKGSVFKVWELPWSIRWDRFFKSLAPERGDK